MTSFITIYLLSLLRLFATISAFRDYSEVLQLTPLAPASVLASFNFRSNATQSSYEKRHFRYFPRSLGQILQYTDTKELHLRFSTGRWDAESWGARPSAGVKEGGTGVEIWAWLEAESDDAAFQKWLTLNNALAGLFCASMNFIDSTRTSRPVMTFEPQGDHDPASGGLLHLLHGTLPREVVCTENLTPFLKLLPCMGKAGIASLLDGHKLFDATWQTMAIDVRPLCSAAEAECFMQIEQTVDMVLDVERSKRPREDPIPRPLPFENLVCDQSREYPGDDHCFPLDLSESQEWSISGIFGKPLLGQCQNPSDDGETLTSVCINALSSLEVFASSGTAERSDPDSTSRCYVLPKEGHFELAVPKQDPSSKLLPVETPPLYVERSIVGHGQERGGVQIQLTNLSPANAVTFVYFETLPWFMKPFLHTLRTQLTGSEERPTELTDSPPVIKDMYYRPGQDRVRGSQLELLVELPPASTAVLTYDFEKAILRYTEYPPDANRGREIASAVIRLINSERYSAARGSRASYLRTTSLMLPLPTPDFSMPYNVIILTSTVIALAFGNIFNLLARRFVGADEAEAPTPRERIQALINRVMGRTVSQDVDEKKTQ